jgi:hypothetical protein
MNRHTPRPKSATSPSGLEPTAEPAAPDGRDSLFGSLAPFSRIHTPKTAVPDPDPGRRLFAPPGGPEKPVPPLRLRVCIPPRAFAPIDLLGLRPLGHSAAGVSRKSKTRPCRPAGDRHGFRPFWPRSRALRYSLQCPLPVARLAESPAPPPPPTGTPFGRRNRASWTRSKDFRSLLQTGRTSPRLAQLRRSRSSKAQAHRVPSSDPRAGPRILPRRPRGGLLRSSFGPQKVKIIKIHV